MFNKAETVLNPIVLALSVLFLTLIILRVRAFFITKKTRIPFWKKELKVIYRIVCPLKAISLMCMIVGIIYFLFIILIFTAVLNEYIKIFFIITFFTWGLLESYLSLSIPVKLPVSSIFRKMVYYFVMIIYIAGTASLFPKIIQTYPFPDASACVLLDIPVRGIWLAGHAGATQSTNVHYKNQYAIDCLKIGQDGRFYKDNEDDVTDFYSYAEAVYAPADGQITQVIDSFPSDVMGDRDKEHPGGNLVILDIGNGKYFYVAHLMKGKIPVKEGDNVKAGTILGYIGNSGNTYFPHLHMHVQNKPTADSEGRITYPFRFKSIDRKRLGFWHRVTNASLIRNDRFSVSKTDI